MTRATEPILSAADTVFTGRVPDTFHDRGVALEQEMVELPVRAKVSNRGAQKFAEFHLLLLLGKSGKLLVGECRLRSH